MTSAIRRQWVKETRLKMGGDILGVQTLRNFIYAATFLASIAISIGFTILPLTISLINSEGTTASLPISGPAPDKRDILFPETHSNLVGIKALIIMSCNFTSFFSFTQAIRYFNHVGFGLQVYVLSGETEDKLVFDQMVGFLDKGGMFFTIGIRGFYFAIPFVFWFISPYFMLASTVCLLVPLWYMDFPGAKSVMAHDYIRTPGSQI
jgi:uncharacterized membrane protein